MKLYIKFGNLSKFDNLYKRNDFLREVLTNETGIRWSFDGRHKNKIENLLKDINYEMV